MLTTMPPTLYKKSFVLSPKSIKSDHHHLETLLLLSLWLEIALTIDQRSSLHSPIFPQSADEAYTLCLVATTFVSLSSGTFTHFSKNNQRICSSLTRNAAKLMLY